MSESAKSNIKEPEVNFVTVEIKKVKKDEDGHVYVVV